MLIAIDWIKDFVPGLPLLSGNELAKHFTLSCAEVEEVIEESAALAQVQVAQIVEITKHPDAEKLNLVRFELGNGEIRQVVCGARNVRPGLKVPFAQVGITLPCGITLTPKKIRGILSEGMLCSGEELGIADATDGLLELSAHAPLGQNLLDYYQRRPQVILNVDNKSLTHRPDLWGHLGIAREFAAIWEVPLADPFDENWRSKLVSKFNATVSPIVPQLVNSSACLGYWGLSLNNVTVGPSPVWMVQRLQAVGLRSINNMVDISNYVMLELGIPLHIFDRDFIVGPTIKISRLEAACELVTIDGVTRTLLAGDTVISDQDKPLVLAGIMGGISSGVTETTTNIFIEVANWQAASVRRTSNRLGLRTDSSVRYEKSLDTNLLERSLLRALELVLQFCPQAQVVGKAEYASPLALENGTPLVITTSLAKINQVLGLSLGWQKVDRILHALAFTCHWSADQQLSVTVPSFRATKDVECEADIIEEVGRMIGYGDIPIVSPLVTIAPTKLENAKHFQRKLQNFLVYHGNCHEIMTYPLIGPALLEKAQWPLAGIELRLVNALNTDAQIMRPSLFPSALEALASNQKNFSAFRFFEIGRTYSPDRTNFALESNQLLLAYYAREGAVFFDLLNMVDRLMGFLKLPTEFLPPNPQFPCELLPSDWHHVHPFEVQHLRVMGKISGAVFSLHPLLLRDWKIKGQAAFFLLNLTRFENQELKEKVVFRPLPRFPSSSFDWTIIMPVDETVAKIFAVLKKVKIKELTSIKVVDLFHRGDEKLLTLRAKFFDPEKTLDGKLLEQAQKILIETLEAANFPLKRG